MCQVTSVDLILLRFQWGKDGLTKNIDVHKNKYTSSKNHIEVVV